ncbi:MAG: aminotransferase class V-fold PLP-dependent enzyme [Burkholderiaceae bacterium]
MSRIPGHRLLHAPGPTHLPEAVLNAMHRQPLDLADERLESIVDDCLDGLRRVLCSQDAQMAIFAANAHGAWEAAIQNLIAPGQTILLPISGHFAEHWAMQAEGVGHKVQRLPWREGLAIDPDEIEQALRADTATEIAAVFVVHTETGSGTTCDLPAIRAAIDASGHPALLVVDVVASLVAAPFEMDAWGIDAVIGGAQKGLMLPPGLSFMAARERAQQRISVNPAPRCYWDWQRRQSDSISLKFCGTPPEHMLFGLQASLQLIEAEGLAAIHARHALLAGAVHAAVEVWSEGGELSFFARQPERRSVSVTPVATAPGVDPEAVRRIARERFQVAMAGGNGVTIGRVFRIGHLGDLNPAMVLGCLGGVEGALRLQGVRIGSGGVEHAIKWLAEQLSGRG